MTAAGTLFDVNCRLGRFPWGDVHGGSAADLLRSMDVLGVDRAVVSHPAAWRHDPATGNRQILTEIAGLDRLRACWVALPDSCGEIEPAPRFVRQALAHGVAAVRVYPQDHGFDLDGPDFAAYPAACAEARLPLLVDLGQTSWAAIEALSRAHPDLAIIVGQIGYRVLRRVAALWRRVGNVYLDLSDLSTHEGLEWLCATFGPDRLVFGTGAPLRDPGEAVTRLLWSELESESVARIAHRTLDGLVPAVGR